MKLLTNALPKLKPSTWIVLGIVFLNSFSWSWLFLSRVSELADSTTIGYGIAVLAFVLLVSLSSYIYIKVVFHYLNKFKSKKISCWLLVELFFMWSAVAFLVSWFSSVIWMGNDGSLDSVLPFATFTPLVSHTPLRFLARFFGFYGLSAALVVLLAVCVVKNLRRFLPVTAGIVVALNIVGWGLYKSPSGREISAEIVAEKLYENPITITGSPDLVILPEYGISPSLDFSERFNEQSENSETFFVGSRDRDADKGHKNELVFGSTKNGVIELRAKSRLIPGGEYLPFVADGILQLPGTEQTRKYFTIFKAVEKGPVNYQALDASNDIKLGSSICASIIATEDYRRFTANGATILTNSASLGIFKSRLFTFQHHGLAKFMATANARSFLQSANDANAFAIDQNGNKIAETEPINKLTVQISTNSKTTPYTRLGEWPAYLGLIFIAAFLVKKLILKFRNKQKNTRKI